MSRDGDGFMFGTVLGIIITIFLLLGIMKIDVIESSTPTPVLIPYKTTIVDGDTTYYFKK